MTLGWFDRTNIRPKAARKPIRPVHRFVQASPILFAGYLFAVSHTANSSFQSVTDTPTQDAHIMAYAPFVKDAQSVTHRQTINRFELIALANKWDAGVKAGDLLPVTPVTFEDSVQDGARGTIFHAKALVVNALLDDASDQARNGNHQNSVDETLLALRLTESLKYSDFHSVFLSNVEEGRAIGLLRSESGSIDDATKANVRTALLAINKGDDQLETLTKESRVQYYDYLRRTSQVPISIEDIHRTTYVTERIASNPASSDMMRYVSTALRTQDDGAPEFLSDLRLAWAAQGSNREVIAKAIKEL